jgi:hypothetical protein
MAASARPEPDCIALGVWRSTADLLFLIDNPVVPEALFPSTEHLHSVEPAHACDADDVRAIWNRYEPPGAAGLLDHWSTRIPNSVRVVRDRAATVVGAALTCEWNAITGRLVRDDPLVAAWDRDRRLHPLPAGHRTLVLRRWLDRDRGEAPGPVQAAIWLDIKRSYLELRPNLGRVYTAHIDPQPYWPALEALGFRALDEPAVIDDVAHQLAALDFGPDSVDGWLATVAARELGIEPTPFLDIALLVTSAVALVSGRVRPIRPGSTPVRSHPAPRRPVVALGPPCLPDYPFWLMTAPAFGPRLASWKVLAVGPVRTRGCLV